MKNDLTSAIQALCPNAQWKIVGDSYDDLKWLDKFVPKPTLSQLLSKINELDDIEPLRLLRLERDRKLSECDWITLRAYSRNESVPFEWATYMQALRDITVSCHPVLDSTGNLDYNSIKWPIKPSS